MIISYDYILCYYTVITSSLHIITSIIITYYYILCYHTNITLLLRIITYSLLPFITISLLCIINALLHHYYIIFTSFLRHFQVYFIITNGWNR